VSGDSVIGGAFDVGGVVTGGAGLMFLPVGHLTPWTIVLFGVGGVLKAVDKGGRSRHFHIRGVGGRVGDADGVVVGCGRGLDVASYRRGVKIGVCFVEVHVFIGIGRINHCGDGAVRRTGGTVVEDGRPILVLV